jgi:hypothetical protein
MATQIIPSQIIDAVVPGLGKVRDVADGTPLVDPINDVAAFVAIWQKRRDLGICTGDQLLVEKAASIVAFIAQNAQDRLQLYSWVKPGLMVLFAEQSAEVLPIHSPAYTGDATA